MAHDLAIEPNQVMSSGARKLSLSVQALRAALNPAPVDRVKELREAARVVLEEGNDTLSSCLYRVSQSAMVRLSAALAAMGDQ